MNTNEIKRTTSKNNDWFLLKDVHHDALEGVTARVELPETSLFFSGHFPGYPLLPGIAQIYMAFNAIQIHEKEKGKDVAIAAIKRVRFRKMITPNSTIEIKALLDSNNSLKYNYTILVDGEIASNGWILIKEVA